MNEPRETTTPEEVAAYEFPSLAVLKDAHLRLLARESEATAEAAGAGFVDDVRDFMLRASATGRILADDRERGIAQTLLSYWVTVLYRAGAEENMPRSSLAEPDESAGRDLDDSQCPWRGLEAYSESSAHLFFGRKHVIAEWTEALREKRLLVVLGASGSGKTSLIRAGLLPELQRGAVPGSEAWSVAEITLDATPAAALGAALDAQAAGPGVLLVIHRLDKIFSQSDRKAQRELASRLLAWVAAPGTERRAVASTRLESAGLLSNWLRDGALAELGRQAFIPPYEARELRAVIEQPAEQIGLRFDEGLVDTLINDFLGDPAALALLQFMLLKLWDARERNRVTWAAYHAFGGGMRAVEQSAEAVHGAADFDDADRELTRAIFLRLVRPGLTGELVAERVPLAALASTAESRARVEKIVAEFEKARLLRVRPGADGGRGVEVTHEALLRKWPRLLQWLDDARLDLLQRQRISVAAAQWREEGRDPSALWSGVLLASALSIRDQLSADELEFVEASERAANRRRNRNRVLIAVVITLLACLFVREKIRKIAERRLGRANESALNLERGERHVAAGDPAGAFLFFQRAAEVDPEPSHKTLHQLRLGTTWRQLPRLIAMRHLPDLTHSELSPDGKYLAGMSKSAVRVWRSGADAKDEGFDPLKNHAHGEVMWVSFHPKPDQPLLAIAIAAPEENGKRPDRGEVLVFNANDQKLAGKSIAVAGGVPMKAWFNPENSERLLILSQNADGTNSEAGIWNSRNGSCENMMDQDNYLIMSTGTDSGGQEFYQSVPQMNAPVSKRVRMPLNWAAFSGDAKLVAMAGGDLTSGGTGELWLWDMKTSMRLPLEEPVGCVEWARRSANGSAHSFVIASGMYTGTTGSARIWGVTSIFQNPLPDVVAPSQSLGHRGAVMRARFSPDGRWLATAGLDHTARLWDADTQEEVRRFEHEGDVFDVAFSPDGSRLATAGRDRVVRIWDVATGALAMPPLNHSEGVDEVAFSADGRSLLTTSRHIARVWSAEAAEPRAPRLAADSAAMTAVSGDGQRALIAVSADCRRALTVGEAAELSLKIEVALWDCESGKAVAALLPDNKPPVRCAAIDAGGGRVALASSGSGFQPVLQVFDVKPGAGNGGFVEAKRFGSGILPAGDFASATFDAAGGRLAVVMRNDAAKTVEVAICEMTTGTLKKLPVPSATTVSGVQFSPGGKFLLARSSEGAGNPGRALLWSLAGDLSELSDPSDLRHDSEITSAAFSADESWLLTGGRDGTAKRWPIENGRAGSAIPLLKDGSPPHAAELTLVLFSPDGSRALTAAKDQTAILWELSARGKTARQIAVLRHPAFVNEAAFSHDGALILTASVEPGLCAWSAKRGELIALFAPKSKAVRVGFAPDDRAVFYIGESCSRLPAFAGSRPDSDKWSCRLEPMTWSFAPLDADADLARKLGTLLSARELDAGPDRYRQALEPAVTSELPAIWNEHEAQYRRLLPGGPEPERGHPGER